MTDQLVSFETAKLAREKGLSTQLDAGDNCMVYRLDQPAELPSLYHAHFSYPSTEEYLYAPTQSLLQKWLREVHKIEVLVYCNASGWLWELNKAYAKNISGGTHICWSDDKGPNAAGEWETYEEALEAGLQEALKLIKEDAG